MGIKKYTSLNERWSKFTSYYQLIFKEMKHLIEPRKRRYVKECGFLSFASRFGDKYSKRICW